MNISRRTDYAIRLLIKLASMPGETVSARELAEAQDVPYSFARSIQRDLVIAGFATASRGTSGGMVLARPASEITLYEVVDAMQGPISCSICIADPKWCDRMGKCKVHLVWKDVDRLVAERLKETVISDLV